MRINLDDFWSKKKKNEKFLELQDAKNEFMIQLVEIENEAIERMHEHKLERLQQLEEKEAERQLASVCVDTIQCPSGYACVNGECTFMSGGSGPGGNSGVGTCDDGDGKCNSGGSDACQQAPTCGIDDVEGKECCGDRCCYYGGPASPLPGVRCYCDECPPLPTCNTFCWAYRQLHGSKGPGCFEGPEGNSCDSCNECFAGTCRPQFNAPCWCEESSCRDCDVCNIIPGDPGFGDCFFGGATACDVCQTVYNYPCDCGTYLDEVTHCVPYYDNPWPGLHLKAARLCSQQNQANDVICPNTCNCHLDCNPCWLCNGQGHCEPDPACVDQP